MTAETLKVVGLIVGGAAPPVHGALRLRSELVVRDPPLLAPPSYRR